MRESRRAPRPARPEGFPKCLSVGDGRLRPPLRRRRRRRARFIVVVGGGSGISRIEIQVWLRVGRGGVIPVRRRPLVDRGRSRTKLPSAICQTITTTTSSSSSPPSSSSSFSRIDELVEDAILAIVVVAHRRVYVSHLRHVWQGFGRFINKY